MVNALMQRIANQIGEKYIQDVVFTREQTHSESTSTMALFFILSPGADPVKNLETLRETSSSFVVIKAQQLNRCTPPYSSGFTNISLSALNKDMILPVNPS
jgi:hypothetical protein